MTTPPFGFISKESNHNAVQLSIIIPFFNEREVLSLCHARLTPILQSLSESYEIVFVDDGSTDDSISILAAIIPTHPETKVVRLSRNFGKEAAMSAGLAHATGAAIIVLDADLQDPPELIPKMVQAWRSGVDVVSMRRRRRHGESWLKRFSAFSFYRILNGLSQSQIPSDTGDFRLMSRRVVDLLLLFPERCRYMKGLYAWVGFPTAILDYDRDPRAAGTTKWNYLALFGLALEGITSFSTAPLRWAAALGTIVALFGGFFGFWILLKTMLFGHDVPGYPSLMAMITLLSGIQLLTIGLLGEYAGKAYMESKQRPLYVVRDVIDMNTVGVSDLSSADRANIVSL